MSDKTIAVEVAYALPDRQTLIRMEVPDGATAEEAILRSGILDSHPEIDITTHPIGIFSVPCQRDTILLAEDRVEIYRPLIADPKDSRKQRVAQTRAKRKGQRKLPSEIKYHRD